MPRRRGHRGGLSAAGLAVASLVALPGCSSEDAPAITIAEAPSRLVGRLAAVDTGDLVLGARFNRQFVSLQFLAVGLDPAESDCLAGVVALQQGSDFAQRRVREVFSGDGMTPEVMLRCVPVERLTSLASSGAGADLSRVPAGVVRSTFTGLAAAGFESAGLTAVESSCLAAEVLESYSDEQLSGLGTEALAASTPFDDSAIARGIPECVDDERIAELDG